MCINESVEIFILMKSSQSKHYINMITLWIIVKLDEVVIGSGNHHWKQLESLNF